MGIACGVQGKAPKIKLKQFQDFQNDLNLLQLSTVENNYRNILDICLTNVKKEKVKIEITKPFLENDSDLKYHNPLLLLFDI